MKQITAIVLMLVIFAGTATAEDYIRMDTDSINQGTLYANIDFYILRQSPEPATITSAVNGFVMNSVGPFTWEVVDITVNSAIPGSFVITPDTNGLSPDTFVVGFVDFDGLPVITEEMHYFKLRIHAGNDMGEFCFDSTFVPPTHTWKWSGPGGTIIPDFIGGSNYGGDQDHCIIVYEAPCGSAGFVTTPSDDQLIGQSACWGVEFEFEANCTACWSVLWRVADGPGTIIPTSSHTALYQLTSLDPGTYPIVLEVVQDCGGIPGYYYFDVIFLDDELPDGDCDCSGAVDIDDVVYLLQYIFAGGNPPYGNPDCTGGVDIDDVVYLINYIFGGGAPPCG